MNKRSLSIALMSILLMIIFTGCSMPHQSSLGRQSAVKYTMYVGLNDKDTYTQIIDSEEAEKKVSTICLKYVDGYTISHGEGAYKDDQGVVTRENSLIYTFYNATDEQMRNIMNEVLQELNQNSILIEKQKVNYDFYEGTKS